jgi:hypothetical protein
VTGHEALIGSVGVALDDLEPEGYARINGEQRRVRSPVSIKRGKACAGRRVAICFCRWCLPPMPTSVHRFNNRSPDTDCLSD